MNPVTEFENKIAEFFGAPYAVATDSCTHGLELCLRYVGANYIHCPKRTYLSVPMLAHKLGIELRWKDLEWNDYYPLGGESFKAHKIYDAAVYWKRGGYLKDTFMCISFQAQKHLALGRGGAILCPGKDVYDILKRQSYDGREPNIPWREQNIKTMGFHYAMPFETAELGLSKLQKAIDTPPRIWTVEDWPDLTQMDVFK